MFLTYLSKNPFFNGKLSLLGLKNQTSSFLEHLYITNMDLTFESIDYTKNIIIIWIKSDDKETYGAKEIKVFCQRKNDDIYPGRHFL